MSRIARCALVVVLGMGLSVLSVGDDGLRFSAAVQAGGGGSDKNDGVGTKAPKSKPAKKKAYVPDTDNLRATKGPQANIHDRLEDYAQDDSLAGLATSLPRLKKFKKSLDRLVNRAKTQQQKIDANNIYTQLQRYKGQKKNKALRTNATRILTALAALAELDRVIAAEKAFYKAKVTTKGIGDDIEAQVDYEDAVKDYNRALKKVPDVPRNQFEKFPKTLKVG